MQGLDWLPFLAPYQVSYPVALITALLAWLYLRGLRTTRARGEPVSGGRRLAFFFGLTLCYGVIHTRFDYYAQYLFFMHRAQHLVLHHLGPFLIALAAPWRVLALGLPTAWRRGWLTRLWYSTPLRGTYRVLQHPLVAPLLFVGLIVFWLTPAIHFDAMLSLPLYHLMNASMLADGLLFWWLMLDPRDAGVATLGYGTRILVLFLVMPPQIALGAYIALSGADLYDVYEVCGRAWPLAPETDQLLGGLLTWIPAAMMSVLGILRVIALLLRRERAEQHPPRELAPGP